MRGYIVGGPVYETSGSQVSIAELRARVSSLGLDSRVGFTGFVPDSATAMRALDIVVHASTDPEPFGLVIAEAMACGTPVVVSRAGGALELTEPDVNALGFEPGDATALARCIEQLGARRGPATAARQRRAIHGGAVLQSSSDDQRVDSDLSIPRRGPLMRVLHVTSGNMYGGVETFLATLARESALVPEMDSEFAVCFEGRCSQELESLGHRPHLLGRVRLSRPHTLIRARRALTSLLRRTAYDVVVCHQPWPYVRLWLCRPAGRITGCPLGPHGG